MGLSSGSVERSRILGRKAVFKPAGAGRGTVKGGQ